MSTSSPSHIVRPRNRCPGIPVRIAEGADGQDLLGAALALARTQLLAQLADETSLDSRMMGTLGFIGALLAADVAGKDVLGAGWWIPLIPIGVAAVACLSSILGVGISLQAEFGPEPNDLFASFDHRPLGAARQQLLADLGAALMRNGQRVRSKQRALRVSLLVLTAGLFTSAVVVGTVDKYPRSQVIHERSTPIP